MPDPSFTVRGPSDGPGIVLVHGLGVSGKYYEPLIRLLSTSYLVVTPDLPGFGASARTEPVLTIPGQAEAMERVVDLLGLERPVLLGHSMGAQVVTEMAVRRPGRTRGVVLVGPVVDPALPTAFDQGWRLARDSVLEPFPLKALTTREFFRARPRTYRQSLDHMLAYRIMERLAEVTAPVEVLRGSHDPIASRAFCDALAAAAPSGRAYELPGARHMAVATRAHLVANLCRRTPAPSQGPGSASDLASATRPPVRSYQDRPGPVAPDPVADVARLHRTGATMAGHRRLTLVTAEPTTQPWIRLAWSGDVDAFSVPPLAAGLRQAWELDPLVLEVDLSAVTFMDTAGLRPLVEAHARLLHRLRLFDPTRAVTRVLQLHGLGDMFLVVVPRPAGALAEPSPLSDDERVRIEQAKGLLMAVHGCDASSAWEILRSNARAHAVPVQDMAALLVDHAPGAVPPPDTVLDDVLAERARAGSPAE